MLLISITLGFLCVVSGQVCHPESDCCAMGFECKDPVFEACIGGDYDYDINCYPSFETCCVLRDPPPTTTSPAPTTTTSPAPTTTTDSNGTTTVGPPTTTAGPTTTVTYPPPTDCGWRPPTANVTTDIVGGYASQPNSWPWMVALQLDYFGWDDWQHYCGASLIDNQWVLTAAHCVAKSGVSDPALFRIILGQHLQNPVLWTGHEIVMPIDSYYVHPSYDTNVDGSNYDICLIKLQLPITYTEKIAPVCLPEYFDHAFLEEDCFITGWGETQDTNQEGILNESPINVITNDVCDQKWEDGAGEVGLIKPNHICAGNGLPGTCNGDSGGPLNCKTNGTWYIAGATSFGASGCTSWNAPDVYTRISHFLDYIDTIISNN